MLPTYMSLSGTEFDSIGKQQVVPSLQFLSKKKNRPSEVYKLTSACILQQTTSQMQEASSGFCHATWLSACHSWFDEALEACVCIFFANRDICPANNKLCFLPHQEGIEAQVVDTAVHPALPWHSVLPVTAGVIWTGEKTHKYRSGPGTTFQKEITVQMQSSTDAVFHTFML